MKNPDGRKNGASQRSEGPALTIVTRLSWQQLLGLFLFPVALWLLWRLWVVAGLFLLATLVAVGLDPAVARLEARGLSRASAVLGVYAVIVVALGGLGYVVGRILASQVRSLVATLPLLVTRWQATLEAGLSPERSGSIPNWLAGLSVRAAGYAGLAVQGVLAGLLVLLIAFYLLVDGRRLWQMGLHLVPETHRLMVDVLGQEAARKLRGYLQGVVLSGLVVGALTGIGLALLGIPYALLFGVLTALLEGIPFFGPLLAGIGPFTFALLQSPTRALIVAAFFVAVQQIEDKALVPRLQSQTTGLHPLIVILSTLLLGTLFGLLGVVLAVPLAAVVQALSVCVTSCFLHPEGAAAWLAERRPDLVVGTAEDRVKTAVGMGGK